MDVKNKTISTHHIDDIIDDNNNLSMYESGRSDVEMSVHKKKSNDPNNNNNIKLQQLSDQGPPSNAAGAILGSITNTLSRVATTLNADNNITAFNTFNDPMFNDEQNYSFYVGDNDIDGN